MPVFFPYGPGHLPGAVLQKAGCSIQPYLQPYFTTGIIMGLYMHVLQKAGIRM